jgi:hypothetical protein
MHLEIYIILHDLSSAFARYFGRICPIDRAGWAAWIRETEISAAQVHDKVIKSELKLKRIE